MRTSSVVALVISFAFVTAMASAAPAQPTASQVRAGFKAATGSVLGVDPASSYRGHYTALVLPPSISNQGRYGRFTLYVVGPASTAQDVESLLADSHTGALGAPGPSRIHWERGRYLSGGSYWLAKRQYGSNIVLWWFGSRQRIDASFTRLHNALLKLTTAA